MSAVTLHMTETQQRYDGTFDWRCRCEAAGSGFADLASARRAADEHLARENTDVKEKPVIVKHSAQTEAHGKDTLMAYQVRSFIEEVPDGATVGAIMRDRGNQRDPDPYLFGLTATWETGGNDNT